MSFRKFQDFLRERDLAESHGLNRSALDYDRKLTQFNSRFDDPKQGEEIIKAAGYSSIAQFLADSDDRKWSKLRMPGQKNYVR
jgi:hypothetical protein